MIDAVSSAGVDADVRRAVRQAGLLFLVAAVLSAAAAVTIPGGRDRVLLLFAAIDTVIAVTTFLLPWRRWGPASTAALAGTAWAVIGASTWALGGLGAGAGAFFVLAFAWMGLHHDKRMILANVPIAAVSYIVALVLADAPGHQVAATVVVIPFAATIGLVIEGRVRRLKAAQQVIEEEQRWRAALMATLAHDVRSPLTTIHGVLEIVADDEELPDHLRPLVAAAVRQTARLSLLASNLLDLERVEGGRLVLDWQSIDLAELAAQVAELLGGTDVSVDIEPGLSLPADPLRLQQMLVNLGTNAQRHGKPPVVFTARRTTGGVEISVRDHGAGVPEAKRPMLFQRLQRTEGDPESVGLGLWIVRLLAQAHGGDATYRPADPGAEFVITMPADRSTRVESMPSGDRSEASAGSAS